MRLRPFNLFKMCLGAIVVAAPMTQGYSAIWNGATSSLSTNTNWIPNTTPNGASDTFFINSGNTTPTVNANQSIGSITFGGATAYTFEWATGPGLILNIDGTGGGAVTNGVSNGSTVTQTFDISNSGFLNFIDSASASLNSSSAIDYNATGGGSLVFGVSAGSDISSAGNAVITADSTSKVVFNALSSAGTAIITSTDNATNGVTFNNSSNAGTATINLNGSSNNTGALLQFLGASDAKTSTIVANKSSVVVFNTTTQSNAAVGGPSITLNDTSQLNMIQSNRVGALNGDTGASVNLGVNLIIVDQLTVNQQDTYDGLITGTGALVKDGVASSSLTLTQAQNVLDTWTATVNNGTLVGNASNLNRDLTINANGIAEFNQTTDDVLNFGADQINGPAGGLLLKTGYGKLDIQTNNTTFGGDTQIIEGNLAINGNFGNADGTLTVAPAGTLSGIGTINNAVVVDGTVAPGNSIGTLNTNGSYTQNADSTYQVELSNAASDLINVTGPATLNGGIVDVQSVDGTFLIATPYTILTASDGVNGTYAGAIQDLSNPINPFLMPNLSYTPNNVLMTLNTDFTSFAGTRNQAAVAGQLDSIVDPSADLQDILQNLVLLSPGALDDALDDLSGQQYTSIFQISQQSNRRFLRDLYGPLLFGRNLVQNDWCEKNCCDDFEVWQTVHYGRTFQRGDHESSGYKVRNIDVAVGAQMSIDNTWTAGVAAFYENDHVTYNLNGRARANIIRAALYGIYQNDCYYGLADAVFGYSHFNVKRDIVFLGIDRKARATPKIYDGSVYLEAGLNYGMTECIKLQPFLGVETGYYWHNNFHEKGADSVNLHAKDSHQWACNSRLGLRATTTLPYEIVLSADVAWQHWYTKDDNRIHLRFTDFGDSFSLRGPRQKRDIVDGSIYLGKTFCDNFTVFARGFGERSDNYSNYSAAIGFDFQL